MAVFCIKKARDYTVMPNHHLLNTGAIPEIQKAALNAASLPENRTLPPRTYQQPTKIASV